MKDKLIQIRADAEFLEKLEYLQLINGFKSVSETIRKIVEKEYRKEQTMSCKCKECIFSHDHPFLITKEPIENPRHCALHFCTVEAEGGCKDGKARASNDSQTDVQDAEAEQK